MPPPRFSLFSLILAVCAAVGGCGATRLTDTTRSASEEMLLSRAIDQAVGQLPLEVLAGQTAFLDTSNLGEVTFSGYLTGALRQHLLAGGARLVDERAQAQVIVEARAGSVATTRHDSLFGLPQTTVPPLLFGVPTTIPEIAIIKRTLHIGVAKVGVFAYRTDNGAGIWQSGMEENQSISRSSWYLGVGPIQTGDIVLDGMEGYPGKASTHLPAGARSPLESEAWVGEMPPLPPWLPVEPPAAAELIEPGEPEPDSRGELHWISPTLIPQR